MHSLDVGAGASLYNRQKLAVVGTVRPLRPSAGEMREHLPKRKRAPWADQRRHSAHNMGGSRSRAA